MIKKEEAKHVAKLARIGLTEEELKKFQKELSSVLDYFELLKEVDTQKTEPTFYSMENYFKENAIREDRAGQNAIADELLKLVPSKKDRHIKVKSVF